MITNPDNNQPPPTDSGTPVQDYVGPQAEVTLPPWRPAPLVQQKQDDSFSVDEMQAIRKEVDAQRSLRVHSAVLSLVAVPYFALLAFRGFNSSLVLFEVGWAIWLGVHSASLFRQNALVGEIKLRHIVAENDALLNLPSTEVAPSISTNPYIKRFQRQALVGIALIALLLATLMAFSLQPNTTMYGVTSVLGLVVGLGGGMLIEYLTLCRGLGRLNEAERQRKIDELISKWHG